MQRENILMLLNAYDPDDREEQIYKGQIIDFVRNNQIISGKENKSGHLTGSAFIINQEFSEVLLLHHAKLDKWLQPGGHSDHGEFLRETALREAVEETGLTDLKLYRQSIFDLDVHLIPARKTEVEHFHYDIRFVFIAGKDQLLQISSESHDLSWVKIEEIYKFSTERSILRMAYKIKKLLID